MKYTTSSSSSNNTFITQIEKKIYRNEKTKHTSKFGLQKYARCRPIKQQNNVHKNLNVLKMKFPLFFNGRSTMTRKCSVVNHKFDVRWHFFFASSLSLACLEQNVQKMPFFAVILDIYIYYAFNFNASNFENQNFAYLSKKKFKSENNMFVLKAIATQNLSNFNF